MRHLDRLHSHDIAPLLRDLSIPAIVGTVGNALYNVVDRLFIGQGCGMHAIAGVSLGFPFMMILVAFGTLIGVGSGALLSIMLGERKVHEAEQVLGQCVAVKVLFGVTIPFLALFYLDPLLILFGAPAEAIPYARDYLRIVLPANLFAHLSFGLSNLMRAEGNAKQSMRCMLLGAGLNTVLDPIFIFGLGLGVRGAAWATNIAMFTSAVYAFRHFTSPACAVHLHLSRIRIYPRMLLRVFTIGLSPFVIQLMASLINITFNRSFLKWSLTSQAATVEVAAMGIVNSVLFLLLMPIFGLSQGMQPIVGYNWGARQYARVREAYALSIKVSTAACTLITLAIVGLAWPITRCFTHDPHLLEAGTRGLRIFCGAFFSVGLPIVTVTYFQSVGRPALAIGLSLFRQFVFLFPLILLLPHVWGVHGIWLATPVSDLLCAVLTALAIVYELRHLRRLSASGTPVSEQPVR